MLWTGNLLKAVALKRFLTPGGGIRLENYAERGDSSLTMKSQLIAIVAALLVVGCGLSEADRALLDAAEEGNIEAVKQHLAAGADVNAMGRGTPLHYAAYGGHKEVAELLIAEGADVNESNGIFTPLDWAYSDNQNRNADELRFTETAALLRKHGAKQGVNLGPPKDIWEAATEGDMEAVKQFIDEGADVNVKNKVGSTPLLYAAVHKEIIELLIAKGADVNAKNNKGITPLDVAIMRKHSETADLLRKHGGKTKKELKAEGK